MFHTNIAEKNHKTITLRSYVKKKISSHTPTLKTPLLRSKKNTTYSTLDSIYGFGLERERVGEKMKPLSLCPAQQPGVSCDFCCVVVSTLHKNQFSAQVICQVCP